MRSDLKKRTRSHHLNRQDGSHDERRNAADFAEVAQHHGNLRPEQGSRRHGTADPQRCARRAQRNESPPTDPHGAGQGRCDERKAWYEFRDHQGIDSPPLEARLGLTDAGVGLQ
jgi:hypothetical protein